MIPPSTELQRARGLVSRLAYLTQQCSLRVVDGKPVGFDVVREGDGIAWALDVLLQEHLIPPEYVSTTQSVIDRWRNCRSAIYVRPKETTT
jgi:hypothetical protein